jgi:hypothetical protein
LEYARPKKETLTATLDDSAIAKIATKPERPAWNPIL